MMKNLFTIIIISLGISPFVSCDSDQNKEVDLSSQEVATPVKTVSVSSGPMLEFEELNATSTYLQKWIIKSNVNGYLKSSNVQLNKFVSAGQQLFSLKTREAESIGNTINLLDSSFKFSGVNIVRSKGSGIVTEINHQPGDYVQDGEQLAVITDTKSFVFVLDLPYEMRSYMNGKNSVQLILPDGEKLNAFISNAMPVMDSAAQTQRIVLKVKATHPIPENLIAKVRLIKYENRNATYLPKAAILTDETQSNFWVMKMVDDSTAAKVEIKKGIESDGNAEILSPLFKKDDKILVTGNFGLADTAKVTTVIIKNQ